MQITKEEQQLHGEWKPRRVKGSPIKMWNPSKDMDQIACLTIVHLEAPDNQ